MVNRILKVVFALPLIVIIILILTANVKLYHSPDITVENNDTVNFDHLAELQGLKYALNKNADLDMQQLYPEGFVFLNALYGLSWSNFIEKKSIQSKYYIEGKQEIDKAWNKINSNQGRSLFDQDLPIPYGAFYTGWSTYLLGKKLSHEQKQNAEEVNRFKERCHLIASAIQSTTFPVSYRGSAWPADVTICIAALSLHDKIYAPIYAPVINEWIRQVKSKLDHNGLIPHSVDPLSGESIETARGSSQSLMLIFLREINKEFADQQFALYKIKFPGSLFGLSCIREYPLGESGQGDVDSGPVIFGMGSAATIVGIGTANVYEQSQTITLQNTVEATGFPMTISNRKFYLFGALPMADAFICWAHTHDHTYQYNTAGFISFHLYSILITLLLLVLVYFFIRPDKPSSERSLHIPW